MTQTISRKAHVYLVDNIDTDRIIPGKYTKTLDTSELASHVLEDLDPASKAVFDAALADGTIQTLTEAGAVFITSGCGPCVGTHLGVPGDGETVISSTNRNFQGRMGNPKSNIYLASPAVVAAAAVAGKIVDPSQLGG